MNALEQTFALLADVATVAGVSAGLASYGRRMTVDVSATAHLHGEWVYLPSRAKLKAAGLFGVNLARKDQAAAISVDELSAGDDGNVSIREVQPGWPIFDEQTCSSGEELVTDRVMIVHRGGSNVIGWRVVFQVVAKTIPLGRPIAWTSEAFVPAPQ